MEANMIHKCWLVMSTLLLPVLIVQAEVLFKEEKGVKTAVFLSPKLVLGAGSVVNKFYKNIDFPKGHIGIKYFNAELVDESRNPVSLHDTYLHHWVVWRYSAVTDNNGKRELKTMQLPNSGVCQDTLTHYFSLGSESRQTNTHVPDPYAIEVGNPADIPQGYEERWLLNVHAIDTSSAVDRMGCSECRCDLYNITIEGYLGGLKCCHDESRCRVREGIQNIKRNFYLRYTVKWVDWADTIVPLRLYTLDATDTGERGKTSSGCKVEYHVDACGVSGHVSRKTCLDTRKSSIVMPKGGYVVYGSVHQHTGAIGSTLYGEDGRKICSTKAIYGSGNEAGNESDYIVGMTACYPQPGSIKISDGETLHLESVYSSSRMHTGAVGLFYLWIADHS